jgi:hypothetical protein
MVCPLGLAEQFTISEMGEPLPKRRLTHDQTFTALSDSKSVNNLTDSSKFAELVYGFCLHRIIYQIISLRTSFPEDRIMLMKFDFAKAYRRIQYDGISSLRCMMVFDNYAFLQLRLSFGGMGCPASWFPVSELITDLANELLSNSAWNPSTCQSPDQHLVPAPKYLPVGIPLEPALPTMLLPPARQLGSSDV